MNNNKRTPVTEKQLELLSEVGRYEKINYYLTLLNEDSHNSLSFEEKLWVIKNIVGNFLYNSNCLNNLWDKYLHYLDNEYLKDAKFYYLFVYCDYCYDLDGNNEHRHLSLFPISHTKVQSFRFIDSSNQTNVKFLNSIYIQWNQELNCKTYTGLLKEIVEECNEMRSKEKRKFEKQGFEKDTWAIKEKQLVLFYKYVYLKGLIIFNNKTEFSLSLLGQNVIFDFESYCHIQRHFAQSLKPDLLNKSYIRKDFLPDNIIQILSDIFLKISESDSKIILLDEDFGICFELNQVVYQLWLIKNKSENTFRISNLYPVERTSVGNDFRELHRIKLADNLYYFSKDKIILP
jgi:hypothetical protein